MKHAFFLAALAILCACAAPVRAETWTGDSLEWMTDDCDLIVRAKVVKSAELKLPGAGGFHDMTVHVQQVLKGKFQGMELKMRTWEGAAKAGGECLLFLKKGEAVYGPKDYRRPLLEGHWTQRIFTNGNPYGAIDLKNPGSDQGVVTANFHILKKGNQILKAVHERVEFTKKNPPIIKPAATDPKTGFALPPLGVVGVDVPMEAEAFKTLYGGSAVYLYVPTDKTLYPKLLQLLKEYRSPKLVSALANYPGPQTEKLLRDFLKDPLTWETSSGGKVVEIRYPIRAAAYGALLRLGIPVPPPVLTKKPGQ